MTWCGQDRGDVAYCWKFSEEAWTNYRMRSEKYLINPHGNAVNNIAKLYYLYSRRWKTLLVQRKSSISRKNLLFCSYSSFNCEYVFCRRVIKDLYSSSWPIFLLSLCGNKYRCRVIYLTFHHKQTWIKKGCISLLIKIEIWIMQIRSVHFIHRRIFYLPK